MTRPLSSPRPVRPIYLTINARGGLIGKRCDNHEEEEKKGERRRESRGKRRTMRSRWEKDKGGEREE